MFQFRTTKVVAGLLAVALFLQPSTLPADSITLKSGETLEGKILTETENEYLMEVQVSESIMDRKVVPKEDVAEVSRTSPDEIAFRKLENLSVGENSLSGEEYRVIVEERLGAFKEQYPESDFIDEVDEMIAGFQEEWDRVKAGDIKLDGEWIDSVEALSRRDEIESRRLFAQMKEQADRGDQVSALNTYEEISDNYEGQPIFPEATELAMVSVDRLMGEVKRAKTNIERIEADFERRVQLAPDYQQDELRAAAEQEQECFKSIMAQAKSQGIKWSPLIPTHEPSLTALERLAAREGGMLARLNVDEMKDSLRITRMIEEKLESGDISGIEQLKSEAEDLWPENQLLENLTENLDEKLAAIEAEKQKEEAEKEREQATEADATAGQDGGATGSKTDGAKDKKQAQAAGSDDAQGEKKPFFMTIPGAIAIFVAVIALLGIVSLLGKRKKPGEN